MTPVTTIQLNKSVVKALKKLKKHPRQSYNELILTLIECAEKSAAKNQYDEFLHKIQLVKMKELWDNKEDEAWESA
jgi:hypothetical protein